MTESAPELPRSFWYVVIGLAAIVIFVGFRSCSGGGGGDSGTPKVEEDVARAKVADARTESRLRSYLRDNFGETTWYQDIDRIEVTPTFVNVYTRLYKDADATEPARAICNAVRFSNLGIDYVRVTDPGGDRIVWTGALGDQPCG